jgi:chaperonin cofactor prefoldin
VVTYYPKTAVEARVFVWWQYFDRNISVWWTILAGGYYYSSDITLKKDIKSLDNALSKINQLNGYSFSWKSNDQKDIWVIAQEVEKVFPEIVHTNEAGIKSVEYGNLVAPIIEAIKELSLKIDSLSTKVQTLFAKYVDQEARINALETRLQTLEAHK